MPAGDLTWRRNSVLWLPICGMVFVPVLLPQLVWAQLACTMIAGSVGPARIWCVRAGPARALYSSVFCQRQELLFPGSDNPVQPPSRTWACAPQQLLTILSREVHRHGRWLRSTSTMTTALPSVDTGIPGLSWRHWWCDRGSMAQYMPGRRSAVLEPSLWLRPVDFSLVTFHRVIGEGGASPRDEHRYSGGLSENSL